MLTQIRAPPSPIFSRRIEDFRHMHGTAVGLILLRSRKPSTCAMTHENGHVPLLQSRGHCLCDMQPRRHILAETTSELLSLQEDLLP